MTLLREIAPESAIDLFASTVEEITSVKKESLLGVTSALCVWMSVGAMGSTTRGLNKAFGLSDPRHYARFFGLSLLMTLMLGLLIVIAIILVMLSPVFKTQVLNAVNLGTFGELIFGFSSHFVAILFLFVAHAGIYWLCPAVKRRFRLISPGTVFSVFSWVTISIGLKFYLTQFNNYDKLYGSLGAVILLLVWFYTMSFVLLMGGQIDALIHPEYKVPREHQGEKQISEPLPYKLIFVALVALLGVPMGIKYFIHYDSFTPPATELRTALGEQVKTALKEGHETFDNQIFDGLLKRHVNAEGLVDYQWHEADRQLLNDYFKAAAEADITKLKATELHALFINMHNAMVIKLVIDQGEKARTFKDIPKGQDQMIATLGGEPISLNILLNKLLRYYFKDPRQLFALCDGSRSGPKLGPKAFQGQGLDQALTQVTKAALATPPVTITDGQVALPLTVNRYLSDFKEAGKGDAWAYLRAFCSKEVGALLSDKTVGYLGHDWNLNRQP